ncbi:MAG: GNAT family N-acetyltransferase [bacterium]
MLKRYKKELLYLVFESWKGSRPAGFPSPPFRKGVSKSASKNIFNKGISKSTNKYIITESISKEMYDNTKKSLSKLSKIEKYKTPKYLIEMILDSWDARKSSIYYKTMKFDTIVDSKSNIIKGGCLSYNMKDKILVDILTVHPNQMTTNIASNKGIGSALLLNIFKKASKESKPIVVFPLTSAIDFYKKFGFEKIKGNEYILHPDKLKEILKGRKK